MNWFKSAKNAPLSENGLGRNSLSIGTKVYLGMGILLAGYALSMITGVVEGRGQAKQLTSLAESVFPATQMGQTVQAAFDREIKYYEETMIMGEPELLTHAQQEAGQVQTELEKMVQLKSLSEDWHNKAVSLKEELQTFSDTAGPVYEVASGFDATDADLAKAKKLAETTGSLRLQIQELNQGLGGELTGELESLVARNAAKTRLDIFLFLGVLIGSSLALYVIVKRWVVGPINQVMAKMETSSHSLDTSVRDVEVSSQAMAEGAVEQEAQLHSTSQAMGEFSEQTRANAEHGKTATVMAKQAEEADKESRQAMEQMHSAIKNINSSAEETASIIKTIDEIAFQTNLLALNAAVEAARAGDAGKGFAVVAEEVRNLAQRSAEAVRTTAATLEQSKENARNGVAATEEVKGSLDRINDVVDEVCSIIVEMAAASENQSQSISGVNMAVQEMESVTRSNSASAEKWAQTSRDLAGQSDGLRDAVGVLAEVLGR